MKQEPLSLSKRSFLKSLGVGAIASTLATPRPSKAAFSYKPLPEKLLVAGIRESNDPEDELHFMSATKLASLIRSKQLSSTEAVQLFVDRIHKVNPYINAVVTPCFERAFDEAKKADELLAKGQSLGPLHGVPMTIKDSIDTEGVVSTGGTQGRSHFVPEKDATTVARLRGAGAILLGKTNTPEFTLGGVSGLNTTSNILFGMSRNPYNTKFSTYGSSGGAGAIVAAGGSGFDIGSDFGGSIRSPSHANGVAGLKPTTGRVPRTGHIVDYGGMFDSYQQLGPMCRKVEDIITLMPIISGPDHLDAIIHDVPMTDPSTVDISKLRVAYYLQQGAGGMRATSEVRDVVLKAARAMENAGCPVSEDTPPRILEAIDIRSELRNADGNAWQERLTKRYGTIVPGPSRRFDYPLVPMPRVTELLELQDEIKSEILTFMEDYDILLCPVRGFPVSEIGDPLDTRSHPGGSFTAIYNVTGYPAGVIRGGTDSNGVPIGFQVVGRPWADGVVMAAMSYLESQLGGYIKPNL
ncbi:amidase [Pelagicoccus sp. SDUM812003]|uniref:amidase n=1 Tax=Pelagicoccus sp. SDUM812003 TaxID=3041267 RepID=UPI00280E6B2C|nr:amidase [Pelagicoccus sp. SDUM812003]MDQ8204681.1 amidase [Pelagicoccus sp. SDUM812003]